MKSVEGAGEAGQRELRKLRLDLGSLVLSALEDPKTVEILRNADGRLWQERLGEGMREIGQIPTWQAEALIRGVAASLKTTITREQPLLEGELLLDGSRFAAQMPPIVSAPTFAIRKKASAIFTLEEYVASDIMTSHQRDVLCEAVASHRNILVIGGTGSGKTTLTNALIAEITKQFPDERIVVLEDTVEIQCSAINCVQYHTSIDVTMAKLLRTTLRMRPDRILVGEVRGAEALDLLMAWNTGHEGGISTLHANNARSALSRLLMMISMHRESPKPIEPLIGESVDVIVHIARTAAGRQVREVLSVESYNSQTGYAIKGL